MKTILFYDTESNGIPLWNLPSEHPDQPRVTQLAAELCIEETGETVGAVNFLIQPDGWEIPLDLQQLTGITMEKVSKYGVPIAYAMHSFISLWDQSGMRCGHNESFDMRMVRIELMQHPDYASMMFAVAGSEMSFADYWKKGEAFCTQARSTKIVNTGRPEGEKKKTASLSEAYEFFTGKKLEGAHNAQVDIMACKAVYFGIKEHLDKVA